MDSQIYISIIVLFKYLESEELLNEETIIIINQFQRLKICRINIYVENKFLIFLKLFIFNLNDAKWFKTLTNQ